MFDDLLQNRKDATGTKITFNSAIRERSFTDDDGTQVLFQIRSCTNKLFCKRMAEHLSKFTDADEEAIRKDDTQ